MYQRENNARGCKDHNNIPTKDCHGTNFTIQARGENYDRHSSSNIHCVLNAMELAKWLTTSFPSSKVVNRWRGTTYKQCVIDVIMSKAERKHTNE